MLNSKKIEDMKPQIKKYLLLFVIMFVATAALYAQGKLQEKPNKKQEKAAVTQAGETKGESAMMDCCKDMAKGENGMKDMMKMCHSMMGNMEKMEKSGEHPAGCSMMGSKEAKPADKEEKVNE